MPSSALTYLSELNSLKREFDNDALGRKIELLRHLERRRLKTADEVAVSVVGVPDQRLCI